MHVVTLFAPAPGMGRTTLAMMLAVGLAGRLGWRTLVLDAAARPRGSSGDLAAWAGRVGRDAETCEGRLDGARARDAGELLDALDRAARGEAMPDRSPPEVVVVDTFWEADARAVVAVRAADLVLVPVRTPEGAAAMAPALKAALPYGAADAWSGLVDFHAPGPEGARTDGEAVRLAVRKAMRGPQLSAYLPEVPHELGFVRALRRHGEPYEAGDHLGWAASRAIAGKVAEHLVHCARQGRPATRFRVMVPPEAAPPARARIDAAEGG